MGALYPSGHALQIPWLKSGLGADQSGCHQALSSSSVVSSRSHAHAKILLQNCYHKVALVVLLQTCYNANDSVALAAMREQKCCNNYRKMLWLLNRSVAGRAWAEVLDGLMPQELEAVLFEVTSLQRVMWFGDCQQGLSQPLEVSRLCFEM